MVQTCQEKMAAFGQQKAGVEGECLGGRHTRRRDKGRSLHSLTPPSLPAALRLATSPLSVRLRNDSLRLRCLLKPLSSSALPPGEPGIMLVCNQEQGQGPLVHPTWLAGEGGG